MFRTRQSPGRIPSGALLSSVGSTFECGVRQYSSVLLCFVDESFKPDLYGFGAVIADDRQTRWLTGRVHEIVAGLEEHGVDASAELHAHPAFHGKDEWATVPLRVRIKVFQDVADAVVASGAVVLLRGVDPESLRRHQERRNYPDRHGPEQVAFQHLLQRVDQLAGAGDTHALVIADERADRERHRQRFATYQAYGTPGTYMHTKLERLLDTVHFAPSHHSRMLQVADLVTYVWVRSLTVVERDPRQARVMSGLVAAITSRAYKPGCWP